MSRSGLAVVLSAGLAIACDGGSLPVAAMRIEIVRAAADGFVAPDRWPPTEIAADGTVTIEGEIAGFLRENRFDGPRTEMARLDGDRIVVEGVETNGTIDDEGTLRNGSGDELRIDLDGRVHGTRADAPEARVTPITAETRRTAMFVLTLGLLNDRTGHVSVGQSPADERLTKATRARRGTRGARAPRSGPPSAA